MFWVWDIVVWLLRWSGASVGAVGVVLWWHVGRACRLCCGCACLCQTDSGDVPVGVCSLEVALFL
jgi:hypothetical protein